MHLSPEKAFGISLDILIRMQNSCGAAQVRERTEEINVVPFTRKSPDLQAEAVLR